MRYLRELEEKMEAKQEGITEGIEQGDYLRLISQVQKKITRGKSLEISADELETTVSKLKPLYQAVQQNPGKSAKEILAILNPLDCPTEMEE